MRRKEKNAETPNIVIKAKEIFSTIFPRQKKTETNKSINGLFDFIAINAN